MKWLLSLLVALTVLTYVRGTQMELKTVNDVRAAVREYNRDLNKAHIGQIIAALSSGNDEVVYEALFSLQMLAPRIATDYGDKVAAALRPLLKTRNPALLHSAMSTVDSYGAHSQELLPDLLDIMLDGETGAASFAAEAIGKLGPKANSVQNALVGVLQQDGLVREAAAAALSKIGMLSPETLFRIRELLTTPNLPNQLQIDLAKAVLLSAPKDITAQRVIMTMLRNRSKNIRLGAIETVEDLNDRGDWALDQLSEIAASDSDPMVRSAADTLVLKLRKSRGHMAN